MVSKNKIIFLIFLVPIFIDQLNGILADEMGIIFPLSQVFKGMLILCFVIYIAVHEKILFNFVCFLGLIFIMLMPIAIANIWLQSKWANAQVDFGFATKLLMLPIGYLFFRHFFLRHPAFLQEWPGRFALMLLTNIFLALLLSLLGFGKSQYGISSEGVSFAFKGYFTAGNELGALFVLLYSLCLYYALNASRPILVVSLTIAMSFFIVLLTMTKTAIISFIVISFCLPCLMTIYKQKHLFVIPLVYLRRMSLTLLIAGMALTILGGIFIADRIEMNIERHTDNLNKVQGNVSNFIVSGRTERYGPVIDHYTNEYGVPELLFGTGWQHFQKSITNDGGEFTAEMDFLDILLENGIIGVTIVYLIWFSFWVLTFRAFLKRKHFLSVPLFLAMSLFLLNSLLSGHILYSALLNYHLAFFLAALSVGQINKKDITLYGN